MCVATSISKIVHPCSPPKVPHSSTGDTCTSAAEGGHLNVLTWARSKRCAWGGNICSIAAYKGHLAVLQWARVNGCPWDHSTFVNAAMGGHMDVLWYLRDNRCPIDVEFYVQCSANAEVTKWITANCAVET